MKKSVMFTSSGVVASLCRPVVQVFVAMIGVLGLGLAPANAQWIQHAVSAPANRYGAAMVFDAARDVSVLFGGQSAGGSSSNLNDTWEWNGSSWTQRSSTGPSQRTNCAMAYDSIRGVTVLFGGGDGAANGVSYGDTWEWNGSSWTERVVAGPAARGAHAMAFDSSRGVVVLFGGVGATRFEDTWEWDGTTWTQRVVSGPSSRGGHAMAYDSTRAVIVLFGGYDSTHPLNGETWEWNGTAWTNRNVAGPSPRQGAAMAYDAARGVSVLFGGFLGGEPINMNYSAQTWDWNGAAWNLRTETGPSARFVPVMTYDTTRGVATLFGGHTSSNGMSDETWEFAPCFLFTLQPQNQIGCSGYPVTFAVEASGAGPFTYQWRKNKAPIDSFANSSAATSVLTIASADVEDVDTYDCLVSNACGSVASRSAMLEICFADLDCNQVVDDADFTVFAAAYNTFLCSEPAMPANCPADLNADSQVDDVDFVLFAVAYARLLCP